MADPALFSEIPIPERALREVQKNIGQLIPKFSAVDHTQGVKELRNITDPLLQTADVVDLSPSHRAAACNILCAVIEACQASGIPYIQDCILEDEIWNRLFHIYLDRSDNAKTKSMKQVFIVLSNLLARVKTPRSVSLQRDATLALLDIACYGQDRNRAKPALQGLSHLLSKDLASVRGLIDFYSCLAEEHPENAPVLPPVQSLLSRFLVWIEHHDTALSASHLIKSYISQVRRMKIDHMARRSAPQSAAPEAAISNENDPTHPANLSSPEGVLPFWVEPVVRHLCQRSELIHEYKTHVFPYCFKPNLHEYIHFLLYLGFSHHMGMTIPFQGTNEMYNNGLATADAFRLLLAAIQSGKDLGVVKDTDHRESGSVQIEDNAILLPDILFGRLLSYPAADVRLAGLSCLVHSAAITRPITRSTFRLLKKHLSHLHGDTDANFRGEVLSHTQRLFDRLRASTATLVKSTIPKVKQPLSFPSQKSLGRMSSGDLLQVSLHNHLDFLAWYLRFLKAELRPTSSYQRHITALKSLSIVLRSGLDARVPHHFLSKRAQGDLHWPYELRILDDGFIRSLQDLMLNPFDDIRNTAASIFTLGLELNGNDQSSLGLFNYSRFLGRAEDSMLKTGRADHADGVARAYCVLALDHTKQLQHDPSIDVGDAGVKMRIFERLVDQLEDTISVAQRDLSSAVNGRPVHGIFAALRYVIDQPEFYSEILASPPNCLESWRALHGRVCSTFVTFWNCVHHVLCNDAPEGYLPDELEDETSTNTKEVLSYSWRGLKEASILLKTIVSTVPIGAPELSFLTTEDFEILARLCFSQLAELRHRGAFSTVSQTFSAFCRRCMLLKNEKLRALPLGWYQETLLCIQDKATAITRRSAGIPSLMVGIIGAESTPNGPLFHQAMHDLANIAKLSAESSNIQDSRLPQVHALNCVKDIFTTSRLSASSEMYISESLDLAAQTLNSKVWSIRNCSLMLFKALIERLLGSSEAQDWKDTRFGSLSRFSYDNYPSLINILANILQGKTSLQESNNPQLPIGIQTAEGVFPALQILQQAPPPASHRDVIRSAVFSLSKSSQWHLRDMAARTVASLLRPTEYFDMVLTLLGSTEVSHNGRHGVLLSLKYIMRRSFKESQGLTSGQLEAVLTHLHNNFETLCGPTCPFTTSAFVEIINLCGQRILLGDCHSPSVLPSWHSLATVVHGDITTGYSAISSDPLIFKSMAELSILRHLIWRGQSEDDTAELHQNWIQDFLLVLAESDGDTCCAVLETLLKITLEASESSLLVSKHQLLLCFHHLISATSDDEVNTSVQFALAEALSDDSLRRQFSSGLDEEAIRSTLDTLENQCLTGSPALLQSALRLRGYFLDFLYTKCAKEPTACLRRLPSYIRLLRGTLEESNPFDIRNAAILSLSGIRGIWNMRPVSKATSAAILGLSLILYDMLIDDDDEIRDNAAPIVVNLLKSQRNFEGLEHAVPAVARRFLVTSMIQSFVNYPYMAREALRRLAGASSSASMFSQSFGSMLAEGLKEDTALFVQEKQNLFKDETTECLVWTGVLKALPPAAVDVQLAENFSRWVVDGIAVLKETAQKEVDGALGWTTKPDAFVLGLRVICGAEVLLHWLPALDGKMSIGVWEVRKALREFADAGYTGEVNNLWLDRIEMILTRSVVREMFKLQTKLGNATRLA